MRRLYKTAAAMAPTGSQWTTHFSTLFTNSYKPFFNSVPKLIISLKILNFVGKIQISNERKSCRRYYQFGNRSFLKGTNFQRRKKMGKDHENDDMIEGGVCKEKIAIRPQHNQSGWHEITTCDHAPQ